MVNKMASGKTAISSYVVKEKLQQIFLYVWLVLACIMVLTPILWMISASFTKGKLLENVPLLPDASKFSLEHFKYLFTYKSSTDAMASDFILSFWRTLTVAAVTTVGIVIISAMSGYVFSRFRFVGKKQMLLTMMLLQMFPSFMGMLALFMIFRSFGWLNTPLHLAWIYIAGSIPTNTYLLRGYLRGIPMSIDEAATIDGATQTQIFIKLILPLSKPMIGFVAVTAFMSPWMDYMLPQQLLNMKSQTVALYLFRLNDPLTPVYYNPLNFMAGALILAIPITIVQMCMQKYIVYGMAAGAEKG